MRYRRGRSPVQEEGVRGLVVVTGLFVLQMSSSWKRSLRVWADDVWDAVRSEVQCLNRRNTYPRGYEMDEVGRRRTLIASDSKMGRMNLMWRIDCGMMHFGHDVVLFRDVSTGLFRRPCSSNSKTCRRRQACGPMDLEYLCVWGYRSQLNWRGLESFRIC